MPSIHAADERISKTHINTKTLALHEELSKLINSADANNITSKEILREDIGWIGENAIIEITDKEPEHWYNEYNFNVTSEGKNNTRDWKPSKLLSHLEDTANHLRNRINDIFKIAANKKAAEPYLLGSGLIKLTP